MNNKKFVIDWELNLNLKCFDGFENMFLSELKPIKMVLICNYLRIRQDSTLALRSYLSHFKNRLSKQCGIILKLRFCAPS